MAALTRLIPAPALGGILALASLAAFTLPTPAPAAAAGNPQPAALSQYVNSEGFHWDTTGPVSSGYTLQSTLGFLQPGSTTPGTAPLYSCQDTGASDVHFLSLSSGCGGQTGLGSLGYVYTTPPASVASVPLYACADGPDQFASTASDCDGDTVVSQLGYLTSSAALNRYNDGYHWVTTGTPPSGYTLEGTLGYLVTNANGAEALYGCQNPSSSSQFLSLDPACEGQSVLGVEGWVYGAATTSPPSTELYRCQASSNYFESDDPGCEGQTVDGSLGWTLQNPLPAPAATTTTTPPTTTTTTVTTPTPAPTPRAKTPRLRVRFTIDWSPDRGASRLARIRFTRLPARSSLTVSCAGRGCPRNLGTTAAHVKRRLRLATLIARTEHDEFQPGQRLTFTVARAGDTSERIVLTIRRNRAPLARLLG